MPRSSSVRLIAMATPPDWPMMATGPGTTRCGRSSGIVIRLARACRLPRQFGPETASPVSAIAARNRAARALAAESVASSKPAVMMVALRAPARAASITACGTWAAGISITMWSGGSGNSA